MSKIRLLIIDDEPIVLEVMQIGLGMRGYEVEIAPSGREAMAILEKKSFDVILLDLIMPVMNGLEVLREIVKREIPSKVLILTGHPSHDVLEDALDNGADGYLIKPSSPEQIGFAIEQALTGNNCS